MSNIKLIRQGVGWQDAYQILVALDVLVTDYSSLAYEYILLERPVILYTPDYDVFVKDRELWIDYEEIAPSEPIRTFDKLLLALDSVTKGETLPKKYHDVLEKLHSVRDGSSCEKIYAAIKYLP